MQRSYKVLVLNNDYVPILVCDWKKAITLILKNKATMVEFYPNDFIRDGHNRRYSIPAVIQLKKYIRRNYQKAPFTKINVLNRDLYRCAYCLGDFKSSQLTLDHVVPKSRGGLKCWTNVVAACYKCNRKKGNLTCATAGMFPATPPVQPSFNDIFFGMYFHGKVEPLWIKWLEVFDSFKKLRDVKHPEELYAKA